MNEPRFVLTLLRHGESVGNAERRWQGQADFPLSETGRAQARALAQRWKDQDERFDRIITSPLARAAETADILSQALDAPVEPEPLWMERNIDALSGLTTDEALTHSTRPGFINPYHPIGGGGEGDWELYLRGGRAIHQLLQRPPGRYLVVSHGGILNQVMYAILGIVPHANDSGPRFRFGNTGFARLQYFPEHHRWAVDGLNDLSHWKQPQQLSEN
jgi:broad specificity phosphatase PhoE